MKHLFGPVFSRRLGLSQGIDLLPPKTCNFDCIYCEINRAARLSCDRGEHVPTDEIIAEIDDLLGNEDRVRDIDFFTITASGEPTLHTGIGRIINHIKEMTDKPVAILTNGSLLYLKDVRDDLSQADIVIPSLDTARPESFRKINRPAKCCKDLATIIMGIALFSHEFTGEVWLEILFVENINDTPEDIKALKNAIESIAPTRVQLNTVARPPYESFARPLSRKRMEEIKDEIKESFDGDVDILAGSKETERADKGKRRIESSDNVSLEHAEEEIFEMVSRRPCTAAEIAGSLNLVADHILEILVDMEIRGFLIAKIHGDKMYFRAAKGQIKENE
jgi:wyosine [tRNA(Phe)-imidazoG37] synthetase (radical SAM superfamily)